MVQPKVLQGSWEQLARRAEELQKYANLYLIIPADETAPAVTVSQEAEDSNARESERIAAIYAGMGKYAHTVKGLTGSEELHNERQKDKVKEEAQAHGFKS